MVWTCNVIWSNPPEISWVRAKSWYDKFKEWTGCSISTLVSVADNRKVACSGCWCFHQDTPVIHDRGYGICDSNSVTRLVEFVSIKLSRNRIMLHIVCHLVLLIMSIHSLLSRIEITLNNLFWGFFFPSKNSIVIALLVRIMWQVTLKQH